MLKISRLADYATLIMHHLALSSEQCFSAAQLAKEVPITLPTISKILKLLNESGLLISRRGVQGGYQLANPPEKISLMRVIQAIEGEVALTTCGQKKEKCNHHFVCGLRTNWQAVSHLVIEILENLSIADMKQPIKTSFLSMSTKQFTINVQKGN